MNTNNMFKIKCCICGNIKILSQKITIYDRKKYSFGQSFILYSCSNCGFYWININQAELINLYNKKYFCEDVYKKGYSNEENYLRDKASILIRKLTNIGYKKGLVLDIGCGFGYFLDEFSDQYWMKFGIDISQYAIDNAKKIVQNGNFYCIDVLSIRNIIGKYPFFKNSFDLITLVDTLEHIPNPIFLIKIINNLLKKDGIFYIYTYNFNGLGRYIWGWNWREFYPPYHLNYFNKKNLLYSLQNNGFSIYELKMHGLSYDSAAFNKFSKKICKIFSNIATFLNIGDHISLIAIKKKNI